MIKRSTCELLTIPSVDRLSSAVRGHGSAICAGWHQKDRLTMNLLWHAPIPAYLTNRAVTALRNRTEWQTRQNSLTNFIEELINTQEEKNLSVERTQGDCHQREGDDSVLGGSLHSLSKIEHSRLLLSQTQNYGKSFLSNKSFLTAIFIGRDLEDDVETPSFEIVRICYVLFVIFPCAHLMKNVSLCKKILTVSLTDKRRKVTIKIWWVVYSMTYENQNPGRFHARSRISWHWSVTCNSLKKRFTRTEHARKKCSIPRWNSIFWFPSA